MQRLCGVLVLLFGCCHMALFGWGLYVLQNTYSLVNACLGVWPYAAGGMVVSVLSSILFFFLADSLIRQTGVRVRFTGLKICWLFFLIWGGIAKGRLSQSDTCQQKYQGSELMTLFNVVFFYCVVFNCAVLVLSCARCCLDFSSLGQQQRQGPPPVPVSPIRV